MQAEPSHKLVREQPTYTVLLGTILPKPRNLFCFTSVFTALGVLLLAIQYEHGLRNQDLQDSRILKVSFLLFTSTSLTSHSRISTYD